MKMKRASAKSKKKRRTTLTLPADSIDQAQRIAKERNVNLSTVVADALAEGLRLSLAAARGKRILASYKTAFAGFNSEELAVLDGVILERPKKR